MPANSSIPSFPSSPFTSSTEPSAKQVAARVRADFAQAGQAACLAAEAAGTRVFPFKPGGKMSAYASWFSGHQGKYLVAVIAPQQQMCAYDDVFGYALAWQHSAELIFVVPAEDRLLLSPRLTRITTPVRVLSYDPAVLTAAPVTADGVNLSVNLSTVEPLSTAEVLAQYAQLRGGTMTPCPITSQQLDWVQELLQDEVLAGARRTDLASSTAFQLAGHKYLNLEPRKSGGPHGSLVLTAGVDSTQRPASAPRRVKVTLTGPLTGVQVQALRAVIAYDLASRFWEKEKDNREHRLQAALETTLAAALTAAALAEEAAGGEPTPLGLRRLRRELPCHRQAGVGGSAREGYIDFLALDAEDHLHVVETKIGGDAAVVAQALDYVLWVEAHEERIRQTLDWPERPHGAKVHLDFVLASKVTATKREQAIDRYFPAQVEALSPDLPVKVWLVDDYDAPLVYPRELDAAQLRRTGPDVAQAVRPPRPITTPTHIPAPRPA